MQDDNDTKHLDEKLDGMEQYVHYLQGKADATLDELAAKDDPESIRYRLHALVDARRFEEASSMIRGREPHHRWCERAIIAHVHCDAIDEADRLLAWTRDNMSPTAQTRCELLYATAAYEMAIRDKPVGERVLPSQLTEHQLRFLTLAKSILSRAVSEYSAKRRIENQLEETVCLYAQSIASMLGNDDDSRQIALLQLQRNPIPLQAAELVVKGVVDGPRDFVSRLTLHPDVFEARKLSVLYQSRIVGTSETAFNEALHLTDLAKTKEHRRDLYFVLREIAQRAEGDELSRLDTIAKELLSDSREYELHLAAEALQRVDVEQAKGLLDNTTDHNDPLWLQLYANLQFQIGEGQGGVRSLIAASQRLPHPDLLRWAAGAAYEHEMPDETIQLLMQLIEMEPNDIEARRNAALVYTQMDADEKAAEQYIQLCNLAPDDVAFGLQLAFAWLRAGQEENSLAQFRTICESGDGPLDAVVTGGHILKQQGRGSEALAFISTYKTNYWDQPQYVLAYIDIAYAAGQDAIAHEGFVQLLALQKAGKAAENVLESKTIDDIVEYMRRKRSDRDLLYNNLLKGAIPWLTADMLLGGASYWSWNIRTQPFKWPIDDRIDCAAYSIYATNGFCITSEQNESARLTPIACPDKGRPVMADLSALITLHELNVLDDVLDYFGRVFILPRYIRVLMQERSTLVLHQPSRRSSLSEIRKAIDDKHICVTDDSAGAIIVEEYGDGDFAEGSVRLRNILDIMHSGGHIGDEAYGRLNTICKDPIQDDGVCITIGIKLCVQLATLQTMWQFESLEAMTAHFDVCLSSDDYDELARTLRQYGIQEEVRDAHTRFWRRLRDDPRITKLPEHSVNKAEVEFNAVDQDVSIATSSAALQQRLPLLSDDRVLQAVILNESVNIGISAFGTDCVLKAMVSTGDIDASRAASAISKLMEWRYRFIIPTADMMLVMAERFGSHPPGAELLNMGRYVHECMRDPGLFGGFEETSPPVSMASQLFVEWIHVLAEFTAKVWGSKSLDENAKSAVIEWIVSRALPSPPKAIGVLGARLSARIPDLFITHTLIQGAFLSDTEGINKVIQHIAKGLGLTEDEYIRIAINAAKYD